MFLALLLAILARERPGMRLVATVLLGFAGCVLLLRPTIAGHQIWPAAVGLASGAISAVAYWNVRELVRAQEPEASGSSSRPVSSRSSCNPGHARIRRRRSPTIDGKGAMFTTLISTEELAERLGNADLVVCDVRHDLARPDAWGEAQYRDAHVPGAVFVHLDRDLSAAKTGRNGRHPLPSPETAAATFARLGIAPGKQVVTYDQGGGAFAARLWWMLRWLGHDAVAVLDGGFAKWQAEDRPLATGTEVPRPAAFAIHRVTPTVDVSGVMASLPRHALLLIDARAPERFRGETEPLDPVAGHIPGARNRPYTQNLAADGTFKHPALLRTEFEAVLDDVGPDLVVHQCGSGVTACHNLLAMEVAGFAGTRLYPGSWSEWCADPARPVATGA